MRTQINKDDLIIEFVHFLNWESQSFENWETIDIFISDTLSEAWILARPDDVIKFSDDNFKRKVDRANGKWLEKRDDMDTYKIILSTKNCRTIQSLTKCLIHEMRHCLDYQNAVKHLSFSEYCPGNLYFNNWSEFRAVYAQTQYEFFSRYHESMRDKEVFDILAEMLGKYSADATAGLIRSKKDLRNTLYYISRYIGASRAIRNISTIKAIDDKVFSLWTMMPQYIVENYGNVFYIGNEWDETEVCELNACPKTYYYNDLLNRLLKEQN